jgi:CO/xanthine dehydrogenase Mo-binding subunit
MFPGKREYLSPPATCIDGEHDNFLQPSRHAARSRFSSSSVSQLGHQSCAAIIRICEDGTVNLITGATDCGQGSDTVLSMMAAEELGVRYEDISIKRVDSAYTPVDPGSYGRGIGSKNG